MNFMIRARSLPTLRRKLLAWFERYRRDLPWRGTNDAYRVWLSEVMLQQTRVAAVIPYYERFLERFPTLEALASAPTEEVLRMWSGLGYYSRARNLQRAAQQIVANCASEFPRE
jgi:A/G-specific adenine glycosylase